jgi:hypothetical protein
MRRTFLLCTLICSCFAAFAGYTRMNLSDAIKQKVVKLDAINNGSYQGKTTTVILTNLQKKSLQIKVDIGTVLAPDDAKNQPMILAGEEWIFLQPSGNGETQVQTFCGNAPLACPGKQHHYSYAGLASDTLTKVLVFIKTNSIFDELGQSAVWAVANNMSLSEIYDRTRPELARNLLDLVCKVTGRPLPEYFAVSAPTSQVPGEPAYTPKVLKIVASFRIILEAPKTLTLGIFNESGEMIQKVFEDKEFPRLGHEFGVEFEAADVLSGKYYIRLKEGATVLQEKMVEIL